MFSAKMAQKSIIFALYVIFATSQVSANVKNCYVCDTKYDGEDCQTNPRQVKFERNCGWFDAAVFGSLRSGSNYIESDEFESRAITLQCGAATYTNLTTGESFVSRGCVPTYVKDESLKVLSLVPALLQVEKIRRCNSDLCNDF